MARPPFVGIVPPIVTPLTDAGDLDLQGLERLVERLIEGGVHGIFVLGTTGEGPYLPMSVRHQMVSAVCDQVRGRLPVLVGITDTIVEASVELAEQAYSAGASAVVLAPPYYLLMSQAELASYTERLVDRLSLPMMLYNMPSCCKTWFDVDTVQRLSRHPRIIGLKDSSGDMGYLRRAIECMADQPEFAFFVGPEEMLVEAMSLGAHGGVNGGANAFPRLYASLYEAIVSGNTQRRDALQAIVMEISGSIYAQGDAPSRIIQGLKSALAELDICGNQMAEPFQRHDEATQRRIAGFVRQLAPKIAEIGSGLEARG